MLILRKKPGADSHDISLDQWLSYLSTSSVVHAKPPTERDGIDPFTKKPRVFRSAPGGAFFDGPGGRCEVEYHAGGLVICGIDDPSDAIVAQIADALNAEVQVFDPNGGASATG